MACGAQRRWHSLLFFYRIGASLFFLGLSNLCYVSTTGVNAFLRPMGQIVVPWDNFLEFYSPKTYPRLRAMLKGTSITQGNLEHVKSMPPVRPPLNISSHKTKALNVLHTHVSMDRSLTPERSPSPSVKPKKPPSVSRPLHAFIKSTQDQQAEKTDMSDRRSTASSG